MSQVNIPEEFEEESSISLWEIATTLGEEKKWIAIITGVVTMATAVVSLLLTPMFTAKTTFIVPNPSAGASAAQAMANLGGLMGGGGAAALLSGGKSSDEMYMEFLKTQSMLNSLIQEFNLQKRYGADSLEDSQKTLRARTKITSNKKAGLITVAVDDEDPKFAAQLANAYVVNLKKLLETFASTEAQMRKEFYEKELIRAKKELQGLTDYRDMKVRESVIAVLVNQYEVAVLDSARESLIQVSEKAVPPEKRAFPKRTPMVLIALLLSLLFSMVIVLIWRAYQKAQSDPETLSHLQILKSAWFGR